MIVINSQDDAHFTLNGVEYFRNYVNEVAGDMVRIYNCFTAFDIRQDWAHYSNYIVNDETYASASLLQVALNEVTFNRSTGGTPSGDIPKREYKEITDGSSYTFILGDENKYITTAIAGNLTLDDFVGFPINSEIQFQTLLSESITIDFVNTIVRIATNDNWLSPVTNATISNGDVCYLRKITAEIWFLNIVNKSNPLKEVGTFTFTLTADTIVQVGLVTAQPDTNFIATFTPASELATEGWYVENSLNDTTYFTIKNSVNKTGTFSINYAIYHN